MQGAGALSGMQTRQHTEKRYSSVSDICGAMVGNVYRPLYAWTGETRMPRAIYRCRQQLSSAIMIRQSKSNCRPPCKRTCGSFTAGKASLDTWPALYNPVGCDAAKDRDVCNPAGGLLEFAALRRNRARPSGGLPRAPLGPSAQPPLRRRRVAARHIGLVGGARRPAA